MVTVHSDSSPGDLVGQQFGPYRLVRRLGVGGMAQTFEAIRTGPSGFAQRVCLKLVLPYFRDDEAFSELFKREAKLVARLRHSNIVGVLDFGEIDGMLYMALELVDGVDLRVLLDTQDRKRLPSDYVALIGIDLARALEHAHNPPSSASDLEESVTAIIHRDISPSNILISKHGEVLLTDFGVAKAVSDTWGQQSNVKGKIPYMPPEQLMGEPLDARADLFAVGVVLYEALTGSRPYAGPNEPATIMAALEGQHVPVAERAPDAPPALQAVIESLLDADRERRPASASDLIELLDELTPPSRTRKELGALVSQTPAAARSRITTGVRPSSGGAGEVAAGDAATVPAGAASQAPDPAPRPQSSRRNFGRKVGLAALALGATAAASMLLWPEPGALESPPGESKLLDERAPGEPHSGEPVPVSTAEIERATPDALEANAPEAGAQTTEAEQAEAPSGGPGAQPAKAEPSKAHLTVAVFPWGEVWINGKARGAAPLKNQALKPGRYKISAGQGKPTRTKTLRLRAGEQKTIVFDLTGARD